MTKLVSENRTYEDEHMSKMLFSYKTTCNVTTTYTPYQLVYALHPLMPTKYIVLVVGGNETYNIFVIILISKISKMEKL